MTDGFIRLPGDSTGKMVDTSELTVGANTVERERMVIADDSGAGALATVTSSRGLQVSSTQPQTITGTVSISGTVGLSSQISVTSTAATNPWSSAPSFNVPVVSASSGLVQISGTAAIVSASSGLVQISGIPTVVVTTSGGLGASTIPIVSASSGLVQISGTATVLSASSGLIQAYQTTSPWLVDITSTGTAGGTTCKFFTQTSGGSTTPQGVASTSPVRLFSISGWTSILSTATQNFLQIYNVSSSNATVGTTTPIIVMPLVPYTSAAATAAPPFDLFDSPRGVSCTGGLSAAVTQTATGSTAGSGRYILEYST